MPTITASTDPATDLASRLDAALARIEAATAERAAAAAAAAKRHDTLKAAASEAVAALDAIVGNG